MCSNGLDTVADCLGVSCRCLSGRSERLSGNGADCLWVCCRCPAGQRDCLAPSKTV
ncbi:hypothetical protein DPMN_013996 [Dreissena polymorpha]|uniref:Uncharacterized protein n=1 Tax=Dreissena polymorpha TaxID=45954 RepID=A0A9D4N9Y1_DREPO|nr:hypothetical protein DPMN_013996 [Dreissena polymorpha]